MGDQASFYNGYTNTVASQSTKSAMSWRSGILSLFKFLAPVGLARDPPVICNTADISRASPVNNKYNFTRNVNL